MRWMAIVLAATLVLAAGFGNAQAPPVKLALVIGNADYDGDGRIDASAAGVASSESRGFVPDLRNPLNDATDIRDALQGIGFRVDLVTNADGAAMGAALASFGAKVAAAPDTAQVVVYYAGHGIQVDGANFLIPVGARLPPLDYTQMASPQVEAALRRVAVPTSEITDQFKELRAPGVNLLILDACRNNPWESRIRGLGRTLRATRGLADVKTAPSRTVIGFSTAPGRTADDGAGRNSPYAGELKTAFGKPGTIAKMLEDVGESVQAATAGRQTPWFQSASGGQVCLASCVTQAGPSDLSLIGNVLPNDGRQWRQRIAAGPGSYATQRFGVSLQVLELRGADESWATIDVSDRDSIRRQAESGDSFAQMILGIALLQGKLGGASGPAEGISWLKKSADAGHPAALEAYGSLLLAGAEGQARRAEGLRLIDDALNQSWLGKSGHGGKWSFRLRSA
jgi:hypothetical protein